jgi:hypothetical protein
VVEVKSLRRSPKLQTPTDWWAFLCGAPRMGTEPFYNYCTGSPQTGIWSSVMKTTLQLEHSKICAVIRQRGATRITDGHRAPAIGTGWVLCHDR